jgi:hypothetical protein
MQGCVRGLLYTHTTKPLTTDYQQTPAGSGLNTAHGDTKHINIHLQVKWDSNGIGEIAKSNDIREVYYADIETISVLFGIWQQQYVHIYGK